MTWQCEECGRIEGDIKKVIIKKMPPNLFSILHFMRLNPSNLDDDNPILSVMNFFMNSEEREESITVKARCHHCGKPLCQQHRILIRDNAFSVDEDKVRDILPAWWSKSVTLTINPQFRAFEKRVLSFLKSHHPKAKQLMQKAYHCKTCWQRHHSITMPEDE